MRYDEREPIWVMGDHEEDFAWDDADLSWWDEKDEMDTKDVERETDETDKSRKQAETRVLVFLIVYGTIAYVAGATVMWFAERL